VSSASVTAGPARVPFNDLSRGHRELQGELEDAARGVVERGDFILGSEVATFEEEFAGFVGAEHCVGVGSGTAALLLALLAVGVEPGGAVVLPANTYIATALAVRQAGATPRFVDCHVETGAIDIDAAREASAGAAALMPVHMYGHASDMEGIAAISAERGIPVIEDAAQAHGASDTTGSCGTLSDAAGFSFYPGKNLGALGDAGAVTTGSGEIEQRLRRLRHLGQKGKNVHVELGWNERLDTIQAAFLRVKLRHLQQANERRREVAARYLDALPQPYSAIVPREGTVSSWHLFPVLHPERDRVREALAEQGIDTGIHYPVACPHHSVLQLDHTPGSFPNAERIAAESLTLPMFGEMTDEEADRVLEALDRSS
jgi:dTDP-4-amino-4,6-dideoxygalactose transaminase